MNLNHSKTYLKAAAIGAIAGMRSASAPAWLSHQSESRYKKPLQLFASFEIVADKLPFTPSRIAPLPLAARVSSGAASAYCLNSRLKWKLAFMGGMGALLSSFFSYHLRKKVKNFTKIPDPILGTLEDLAMFKAGSLLFNQKNN